MRPPWNRRRLRRWTGRASTGKLAGTGLDVWEVVETVKDEGNSVEAAANYLDIPVSRVQVAIRYYADHRG